MKKKKKRLPNKMSALLRLAVKDAQKCEKSKKYVLSMWTWHNPEFYHKKGHICYVCLAGSVMAQSLCSNPKTHIEPWDFKGRIMNKLEALDSMRHGQFEDAAAEMEVYILDYTPIETASKIIEHMYDDKLGRAPWVAYEKAAQVLSEAGL